MRLSLFNIVRDEAIGKLIAERKRLYDQLGQLQRSSSEALLYKRAATKLAEAVEAMWGMALPLTVRDIADEGKRKLAEARDYENGKDVISRANLRI